MGSKEAFQTDLNIQRTSEPVEVASLSSSRPQSVAVTQHSNQRQERQHSFDIYHRINQYGLFNISEQFGCGSPFWCSSYPAHMYLPVLTVGNCKKKTKLTIIIHILQVVDTCPPYIHNRLSHGSHDMAGFRLRQ